MFEQGELFQLATSPNDEDTSTVCRYRLVLVREPGSAYAQPVPCSNPDAVARFLHGVLAGFDREVVGVLFLDGRTRAIGHTFAYVGGLNRSIVEPRGVFAPAMLANAASVILFHNHPSGDPSPSRDDLKVTEEIAAAGRLLGIRLLDHVILGEAPLYLSLRAQGRL